MACVLAFWVPCFDLFKCFMVYYLYDCLGGDWVSVADYVKEVKESIEEIKKLLYSILETLEILEDRKLMEQIRESERQIERGEYERFL